MFLEDLLAIMICALIGGVGGAAIVQGVIITVNRIGWWLDDRRRAAEERERERCREANRILLEDADRRRTIHRGHL